MEDDRLEDLVQKLQGKTESGENTPSFGDRSVNEGANFTSEQVLREEIQFNEEVIFRKMLFDNNKIIPKKK